MVLPDPDERRGSSAGGIDDLNPERVYDVDIRRLDEDSQRTARVAGTRNEGKQRRVARSLKAAKAAGKYRTKRQYDEPFTDLQGQTPAIIEGDRFGRRGSTNYADKPQPDSRML